MEARKNQPSKDPCDDAPSLAASILSKAILSLLSVEEDSLKFLDLFQEAIGNATDEYNTYLRTFKDQVSEELSRRLDEKDSGARADCDGETANTNTMIRKSEQIRLAIDIEDIVDELQMLKQLFTTQTSILERGCKDLIGRPHLQTLANQIQDVLRKLETQYVPQIEGMLSASERLRQKLFDLQNLQQKEEDIHEAQAANRQAQAANQQAQAANRHAAAAGQQALFAAKQALSAQDQADAAEAQSWILFIFTVVTIVFLPLSFLTSYFGMFDVKDEKNEPGDTPVYSPSYVGKVMWGFSGPFYTVALVAAFVVFRGATKSSAKARTKDLLILEYKHQLPAKLIDEDNPEFKNMEAMRKEVYEQLIDREQKTVKTPSDTTTTAESQSFTCRKMLPFSRRPRRNDVETARRQ